MTRKDYELIASAIRELPYKATTMQIARKLAEKLQSTNPRFDQDRFIAKATEGV